jgi:hypothetical protein
MIIKMKNFTNISVTMLEVVRLKITGLKRRMRKKLHPYPWKILLKKSRETMKQLNQSKKKLLLNR